MVDTYGAEDMTQVNSYPVLRFWFKIVIFRFLKIFCRASEKKVVKITSGIPQTEVSILSSDPCLILFYWGAGRDVDA